MSFLIFGWHCFACFPGTISMLVVEITMLVSWQHHNWHFQSSQLHVNTQFNHFLKMIHMELAQDVLNYTMGQEQFIWHTCPWVHEYSCLNKAATLTLSPAAVALLHFSFVSSWIRCEWERETRPGEICCPPPSRTPSRSLTQGVNTTLQMWEPLINL